MHLPRFRYFRVPFFTLYDSFRAVFQSGESGEIGQLAARTFSRLRISYILDGSAYGLFFYAAFVLAKGFNASPLLVALTSMCFPAGLLLAYPVGYFFEGRKKNALFTTAAVFAAISAIGFALFPSAHEINFTLPLIGAVHLPSGSSFLLWLMLFGIGEGIKFPARLSLVQTNFAARERSRLFGALYIFYSTSNVLFMFGAGYLLDKQFGLYRLIIPAAMLISFTSNLIYRSIPSEPLPGKAENTFALRRIFKPFVSIVEIARREPYFMGFELAYFFYGCGFMMISAILPTLYKHQLGAQYGQYGVTGIILNAVMFLSPFIGRWVDRRTPTKLASIAFSMNALFPIMLLFCMVPFHGYMAHVWYSIAVVADLMAWNMGPIFFSAGRDAITFVGINATFTGIRAILAFSVAGFLKNYTDSFAPVLISASSMMVLGLITMLIVHRMCVLRDKFDKTRSGRFFYVE